MTNSARPLNKYSRVGLLMLALFMTSIGSADCIKDLRGEVYCGAGQCMADRNGIVWCSRYDDGDAIRTEGQVLCGKGQCEKDSNGQVFCSSEVGGAVVKDSRGHVRCYGQCEPATVENCENTLADSTDS
jgi:hypothetical protein